MAIITTNSNVSPMPLFGCLLTAELDNGYYAESGKVGSVINTTPSNQIIGLVPVFPCSSNECRVYGADEVNDLNFVLPVFAKTGVGTSDAYFNDYNSFLFDFIPAQTAGCTITFYLDKQIGNTFVQQAILNNNGFGIYYGVGSLCNNANWTGYKIQWFRVLAGLGEGVYRFRVQQSLFGVPDFDTCFASPPFCLKTFDCNLADRTTKFESFYSGGRFGNVNKSLAGNIWEFCCKDVVTNIDGSTTVISSNPIQWNDSVRMEGFFGYENTDYERKNIKYQTGLVNKIRDEAIIKFQWKSGSLPFWLHERFKFYGLAADGLVVSDYNVNNSNYNINKFNVIADGAYNPVYKGWTRNSKVTVDFKAQIANLQRARCC